MFAHLAPLAIGACTAVAGVAILVRAEPIAKFMTLLSDTMTMYPEKWRRRIYTVQNFRIAGATWILGGLVSTVVAVVRLIDWLQP